MATSIIYSLRPIILVLCMTMMPLSSTGNIDVDALIALKNNVADPENVLSSWDENLVNPCTWIRVTCNGDNRVTRFDIGNSNLTGKLVPDLGNLEFLEYMELYENKFEGTIPTEFGNLKNLISMDLYENNLSGTIPASLGNLKSLLFLRLNDNHLTGKVPQEVLDLNLRVLNVTNNDLSGGLPTNLDLSRYINLHQDR